MIKELFKELFSLATSFGLFVVVGIILIGAFAIYFVAYLIDYIRGLSE